MTDTEAALREAASAVALDYHDLAIAHEDGDLHPAVTWGRCTDPKCVALREALAATPPEPAGLDDWQKRLVKAASENTCGDLACQTRRTAAAIRVLTGGKEHQDYCWAVETFEVEMGVRDPATVGPEPSDAMLDAALRADGADR